MSLNITNSMENACLKEKQLNLHANIPKINTGIIPKYQEGENFNFIDENIK